MRNKETEDWFEKEQLHIAADEGDLIRVKKLVEEGRDVNAFDSTLSFTPLHYAAKGERIEIVKYLLSVGADVNAHEEDKIGETPLGAVAENCSYELAELLGALKIQVQHLWEIMLHGKNLRAVEY